MRFNRAGEQVSRQAASPVQVRVQVRGRDRDTGCRAPEARVGLWNVRLPNAPIMISGCRRLDELILLVLNAERLRQGLGLWIVRLPTNAPIS